MNHFYLPILENWWKTTDAAKYLPNRCRTSWVCVVDFVTPRVLDTLKFKIKETENATQDGSFVVALLCSYFPVCLQLLPCFLLVATFCPVIIIRTISSCPTETICLTIKKTWNVYRIATKTCGSFLVIRALKVPPCGSISSGSYTVIKEEGSFLVKVASLFYNLFREMICCYKG